MNSKIFFNDKPLFGLDLSFGYLNVMQLGYNKGKPHVAAFGAASFDKSAIKEGVIVDPEAIAKVAKELFKSGVTGKLTTRRIAVAIPAARTFGRAIQLPALQPKELHDAVMLEVEQYIPVPLDELYVDYTVISKTAKATELFALAAPKKIVDSYVTLSQLLGLEVVAIETSIDAITRLFSFVDSTDAPTVLVDFGTASADITIVHKTVIATGTVGGGSDNFTNSISNKLGVTEQEAHVIKTKYGLNYSKKQREITEAVTPVFDQLFKEIRRMLRYYEERYNNEQKISQIVILGSGSNMPGLNEHMTNALRLPVRMANPWEHIEFAKESALSQSDRNVYSAVAGLSLIDPKRLFA